MKIMIVDDDRVSKKVLAKALSGIGECTTLDSGREAITNFNVAHKYKKPFDLIMLDISMPDINGMQVLSVLRKQEEKLKIPMAEQAKIVMLTASMVKSSIKKCIRLGCNSYISKPFKKQKLFQELERLGFKIPKKIKTEDKNQKSYTDLVTEIIKRFNEDKIELPVLPHMVQEVQKSLEASETSIDDVAAIVEKDAIISTKLISIANSSLYKGFDAVKTLNKALLRLGLKETLDIITTMVNKNLYHSENKTLKTHLDALWMHSLACACCCKFLSEELKEKNLQGVFLMGIIHDIGKVLLLNAIADISPDESFDDKQLQSAVQDVHTVFGAVLIQKWGFAKKLIRVVKLHHWKSFPEETEIEIIIVHLADLITTQIGFGSFKTGSDDKLTDEFSPETLAAAKQLGIDPERIKPIGEMVIDAMKNLSDNF